MTITLVGERVDMARYYYSKRLVCTGMGNGEWVGIRKKKERERER